MHAELLKMAADLSRGEQAFVLALVVRRRPASSAQAGDMAIITADGGFHGWLGGSCIQPTVVREAQRVLAEGKPRLLALTPDPESERRPGVAVFPMTCHSGGTVEIYLEPIQPAPRLTVFGVSPTARALVRLGAAMGYAVTSVEDPAASGGATGGAAAGFARAGAGAAAGAAASAWAASAGPAPGWAGVAEVGVGAGRSGAAAPAGGYVVVATMGEDDEAAIRAALALAPDYLGVVASAKRFATMRATLVDQGVGEAALAGIRSPAGLAIGAHTPEEIALSVLAEIVELRRSGGAGGHLRAAAEAARPAAAAPSQAIDPICGMSVDIAGARHTAEHGGRVYYFCCGGCRTRFLAAPDTYAAVGGAA